MEGATRRLSQLDVLHSDRMIIRKHAFLVLIVSIKRATDACLNLEDASILLTNISNRFPLASLQNVFA